MRGGFKLLAEHAIVGLGVERVMRRMHRDQTVILAYHNVLRAGERVSGDSSLHLAREMFVAHLNVLSRSHDVIPLADLLTATRSSSKPRAVITFDDAYAGALTTAVEELVKRAMPATVFVAPGLLGCTPWWDELASRTQGVLPNGTRRHALERLAGKTDQILLWDGSTHREKKPKEKRPLIGTEAQVMEAAAQPGITLGSHSWSHPNLAALSPAELHTELSRPLHWLASRTNKTVPWLAFPYGLYNEAVTKAVSKAGYTGALRIDGGLVTRHGPAQSNAIPRINIPAGVSQDGFRLRLVGL